MNKKLSVVFVLIIFVLGAEVFLRWNFGFCDAVLFREDPHFEYIAQPNQERFRYGNCIKYNSNSMRSEEVDTSAHIIIGFGDSIINGGMQTDHDELATTILSDTLTAIHGRKVQFLNISGESWGPDNAFEYLRKHGHFEATSIYLFVSSHDEHDTISYKKTVGINENYPVKQYAVALVELWDRYLIPRTLEALKLSPGEHKRVGNRQNENRPLNKGFMSFVDYSKQHNIPLTIYLHAEKVELESGSYNANGQKIIQFAKDNNIPLILGLESGLMESHYRDELHIHPDGQRQIAEAVVKHIYTISTLLD